MAYTLNNIASDKANQAAKRGDAIRVKHDEIVIVDGFNIREDDDELREHIAGLLASIAAGQPIPLIEVWVNPETGVIELVDGHCRHIAYSQYREMDMGWDGYVSAQEFKGTPFQRKMRIASSNKQLKLKPVELGRLYIHARDELGASRKEIAAEAGMSVAHVDQMILLAGGSPEIQQAIDDGKISTTEGVKLIRDHGDDALAELERRQEIAKELGKDKVTAKASEAKPKAPSRPKVDFVTSCAVVLVNRCKSDSDLMESLDNPERNMMVSVDAELLADLIGAVDEMRQAGKALDADKQVKLFGGDE